MDAVPDRPRPRGARCPIETIGAGVLGAGALLVLAIDWQLAWMPALAALLVLSSPRRCVIGLALATSLLLLVGGAVTTYRVGMAVPDWPATMGRNMFTYPLQEMLAAGWGVTLEHSHRLWASLVGLVTLGVAYTAFARRTTWRGLAAAAVVVVIAQGVLGGSRVLENDPSLAFLHGSFAQVFYGIVCALLVVSSPAWERAERRPWSGARGLRRLALAAAVLVYGQVVAGAWLRHSGSPAALVLHTSLVPVVVLTILALGARLDRAARASSSGGSGPAALQLTARWLRVSLATQVLLGLAATAAIFGISQGFQGQVSLTEAVTATLHVAVGALLLGSTVSAALWSRRAVSIAAAPAAAPARATGAEAAL